MDPASEVYPSISGYTYVNNNPIRQIDPTGMFSEDALFSSARNAIGTKTIYEAPKEEDHPGKNDAARIDNVIISFRNAGVENASDANNYYDYKGPSTMFSDPENGQPWQYVYTEVFGWIDLAHFFKAASWGSSAVPLGEGVEFLQEHLREASPSAYSYEDLPSNLHGAIFIKHNGTIEGEGFYTALKNHFEALYETDYTCAPNWSTMPEKSDSSPNEPKNLTYKPIFAPRYNEVDAKYKLPFKYID